MKPPQQLLFLPHTARACGYASAIGGILSLAWGFALPAVIFLRNWNLRDTLAVSAVLALGTTLLVLARFLKRRRAIWAAQGLWAVAVAMTACLLFAAFAWHGGFGRLGWFLVLIALTQIAPLGWNAWLAVAELRLAADERRGFAPVPLDVPIAERAPVSQRSDNDLEK